MAFGGDEERHGFTQYDKLWIIERIWLLYHSRSPAIWAVTKHLERTGWDPFIQFFHQIPIEHLLGVISTGLQEWTTQKRSLVSQAFWSILCFVSLPPSTNGAGARQRVCFSMGLPLLYAGPGQRPIIITISSQSSHALLTFYTPLLQTLPCLILSKMLGHDYNYVHVTDEREGYIIKLGLELGPAVILKSLCFSRCHCSQADNGKACNNHLAMGTVRTMTN